MMRLAIRFCFAAALICVVMDRPTTSSGWSASQDLRRPRSALSAAMARIAVNMRATPARP